jgi:hypothetical protein
LTAYLRNQNDIRAALEKALARDQREWDPDGPKVNNDVWTRVKVESLELRRRNLANPELVAHLKSTLPPKLVKLQLSDCDSPGTSSSFVLVLECDWDDEHSVRASLRDGKLIDVDHQ